MLVYEKVQRNGRVQTTVDRADSYGDEEVIALDVYSAYAGSETIGAIASFLKQVVTLGLTKDDVGHWWVVFETSPAYYVAQFGGRIGSSSKGKDDDDGHITMNRCTSLGACHQFGLDHTQRITGNPHVFHSREYSGKASRTIYMREVFYWLRSFSPDYGLFTHNCQDFVRAAYREF